MKKIILILIIPFFLFASNDSLTYDNCTCPVGYHFENQSFSNNPYVFKNYTIPLNVYSCYITGALHVREKEVYSQFSYDSVTGIYGYTSSFTTDYCIVDLNCDNNQTADYTLNPPACVDNPNPPLQCPANAVPDANNTYCICQSPYVPNSATQQCELPPSLPDENSTKPDGTCEPGFSKNKFGNCKIDSDNDNVPDSEDAYPNDPTQSGGDSKPKICTANKTECSACKCPVGTMDFGAISLNSLPRSCVNGAVPIFCSTKSDTPAYDCRDGYVPAPDYASTANCVPANKSSCNYDSEIFGWKFQSIVATDSICYDLRSRYAQGGVTNGFNFTCDDGTIACYYNPASDTNNSNSGSNNNNDTNNTGSGNLDNNSSTPPADNNSSSPIDTKTLENKLDVINNSLGTGGAIAKNITNLGSLVSSSSKTNHADLQNLNGTLTSKLDLINNSIKSIPQSQPTDMTSTNNHLQNIEDKLDTLTDIPLDANPDEDFNGKIVDSANQLSTGLKSYINNYTPAVSLNGPSGSCTDITIDLPIGGTHTINFSNNVNKLSYLSVIIYFISIFGAVVVVLLAP